MPKLTAERETLLDGLVDEILRSHSRGRVIVAIDGVDGAGKSWFADDLADRMRVKGHTAFRASVDGFHRPRAERHLRGKDSAEGFYLDSYDYSLLRRVLVEPFRLGGGTAWVAAAYDWRSDSPVQTKWQTGPANAVLVLDGIFLNRPELRDLWSYSVWLDVPDAVAQARLIQRDGSAAVGTRYAGGRALYVAEASPREVATVIIDNTDYDSPRRVSAD